METYLKYHLRSFRITSMIRRNREGQHKQRIREKRLRKVVILKAKKILSLGKKKNTEAHKDFRTIKMCEQEM